MLNSPENVQKFIEAEAMPLAIAASEVQRSTRAPRRSTSCSASAPAVVMPPDTGYDLEVADALYAVARRGARRPDPGRRARRARPQLGR